MLRCTVNIAAKTVDRLRLQRYYQLNNRPNGRSYKEWMRCGRELPSPDQGAARSGAATASVWGGAGLHD